MTVEPSNMRVVEHMVLLDGRPAYDLSMWGEHGGPIASSLRILAAGGVQVARLVTVQHCGVALIRPDGWRLVIRFDGEIEK